MPWLLSKDSDQGFFLVLKVFQPWPQAHGGLEGAENAESCHGGSQSGKSSAP